MTCARFGNSRAVQIFEKVKADHNFCAKGRLCFEIGDGTLNSKRCLRCGFLSIFYKMMCSAEIRSALKSRTALVRSALETPVPGVSNGGSNVEFRHFGAVMAASKVVGSPRVSNLGRAICVLRFDILGAPITLKAALSAPKGRKSMFDPPAPGTGLSSTLRISAVRLC